MAIQGNLVVPEYQAILDNILASYGKKKQQAEASGIGEAMRRGLINEGGTSDIEGMIRQSKVAPIEEAEGSAVSGILKEAADRAATERYGTSEREARQVYDTSERMGSQDYNKMLQEYMNQYNMTESQKQRDYETEMANLSRRWSLEDSKRNRKGWWKNLASNVVGTGLGTATGILTAGAIKE